MSQFRKAERRKAKLRLALCGPSGSGKTLSSLLVAKGLIPDGGRVALIDTEAGSGEQYAGHPLLDGMEYDTLQISAPFTSDKYVKAIKAAEAEGYEVIVIDSLTHQWTGSGGALEQVDKHNDKIANSGWRVVTPEHNRFVEAILQCKSHVIATMRSKVHYTISETQNRDGKTVAAPKKLGMAPIQREGMEYEYTVVLDIDEDNEARASKDRTSLFSDPVPFVITPDTGRKLREWLESGKDAKPDCVRCKPLGSLNEATTRREAYDLCEACAKVYDEKKAAAQAAAEQGEAEQASAESDGINKPMTP